MEIISHSVNETINIGKTIAKHLKEGDIIGLFGQLGSGKTVLTKGIAAGLGIKKNLITSPSFILIHPYLKAKIPFYHFDLYRLNTPKDILALGYEEYFYNDAIKVIEWAERLKYLLPKEFLKIELGIKAEYQRLLRFSATGPYYKKLLQKIDEAIRH